MSVVTPSTVVAEGVYQFLKGSMYGAIWGMVCLVIVLNSKFVVKKDGVLKASLFCFRR